MYFYGCRCAKCVKAESVYQRKRKQAKKAEAAAAAATPNDQEART